MPDPNLLSDLFLFKGLSSSRLSKLAQASSLTEFSPGDVIFQKDEAATHLYGIVEGQIQLTLIFKEEVITREIQHEEAVNTKVEVFEKPMIIDQVDSGEIFGWSALVEPEKMTATAVCTEECRIFSIPSSDLKKMFKEDPELGFLVMSRLSVIIARRLRKRTEKLVSTWGDLFDTGNITADI